MKLNKDKAVRLMRVSAADVTSMISTVSGLTTWRVTVASGRAAG